MNDNAVFKGLERVPRFTIWFQKHPTTYYHLDSIQRFDLLTQDTSITIP